MQGYSDLDLYLQKLEALNESRMESGRFGKVNTSIAFEQSLRSAAKELPPSLLEAPGVWVGCSL